MIARFTKWNLRIGLAAFIFSAIFFSSCTRKFYVPNQVHVPSLQQRNDFSLSGGLLTGDQVHGVSGYAAYSPLNNFGIIGSYSSFRASERENPSYGYLWDLGAGAYFPTTKANYEFYGGYGRGLNHQSFGVGTWGDFDIERYFIQGAFTIPTKYFHFFAGVRMCLLRFNSGAIVLSEEFDETANIEFIRANSPFTMVEPTWGVRIGRPGIYMVMQRTSTFSRLSQKELTSNMASIGFHITPDLFTKGRKKKRYNDFSY